VLLLFTYSSVHSLPNYASFSSSSLFSVYFVERSIDVYIVASLLFQLLYSMTRPTPLSNSQLAATLAEYRQRCDGPPDLVVQYGEQLMLAGYTSQLGDEVWAFYEQLFVAALHTARWSLAQASTK
jgi:hypothetical protein